jgi:uncharacterized protein YdhG (YjbR/CyaY superfamily)
MPNPPTAQRASRRDSAPWTKEERAAAQAAVKERQAAARGKGDERAEGLRGVMEAIAKMPVDDRAMAERIHELILQAVPSLVPKTYYGMPGYASDGKNGKPICFFKPKSKFRVRYSNLGFQPAAQLDEGDMWATEFAVIALTPAVEKRIVELVKKAVG